MKKNKFVLLALFISQLAAIQAGAQIITRTDILQKASVLRAREEIDLHQKLLSVAKQKKWPLLITDKNGHRSYLAGMDMLGYPLYIRTHDDNNPAATIKTNQLWPGGSTGLNLSGSSANLKGKLAIWDGGGVLLTHVEFGGRVVQEDGPMASIEHATSMSGIMIAKGVNPIAKGMSFGAQQLNAYSFVSPAGTQIDVSEMMAASPNLLISNHSYGFNAGWVPDDPTPGAWTWYGTFGDTVDYKFGYYDQQAQDWDSIAYNAPDYLIVNSAGNARAYNGPAVGATYNYFTSLGIRVTGKRPANISSNDGYKIISSPGIAKNILTIGAINSIPGGYNSPSDVVISDFSSWGPTDDGRIKPDVVTDGVNVLAPVNGANDAYAIGSGTSEASASASGSSFLLQEYYSRLHSGAFMRAATLKGIIIHTADEAGPDPGPDYQFGWGLIDMPQAASVITSDTMAINPDQKIFENNLLNDSSFTLQVVASGKGALAATICWTDPKATIDPIPTGNSNDPNLKLVNDLDLRITSGASTYLPWILDPANPAAAATTGDNFRDNVEKIAVPNPVPGHAYTIKITHKGTLQRGSQAYSLIASGIGGQGYCVSAATSSAGTRIDQVNISNINNTNPPGCTTYTDYTGKTINLQSSQNIPFTINLSSCDATNAQRVVKIFIDFNNNGSFTDPGETVAISTVLSGGVTTYSGTFAVPAGMQIGSSTLMRIVAEETTDTSAVKPCGNYPNGETEDFRVQFVPLSNDISMNAVVDPASSFCQTDSERISVLIKNTGANSQVGFPISLKVTSGGNTLVDVTTVCPDTVPSLGTVIYTFQPPFSAVAGKTYVVTASAQLSGDQDPSNNSLTDSLNVNAGSAIQVTAEAEICNDDPPQAGLKANTIDSTDAFLWYDSQNATTPIAAGVQATTTVIPSDKTYYLGLNDLTGSIGPKTKLENPSGGYNFFQGNFIRFTNNVPLTISSARLYVGNGGKVQFIVGDLASFDSCTGAYSYFQDAANTIDVYPTTPNPQHGAVTVNSATDTGAVFLLNLPVPTPGNHVLIVVADPDDPDSATLFRNNNITTNGYPYGIPGVFSITGNSAVDLNNCKDTTFYQKYYYFLYDLKLTLGNCPSPRIAVPAKTPTPALIALNGVLLSSNYPSGNQWYRNDTLLTGQTGATDSAFIPGTYKSVVTDSVGCVLVSNTVTYSLGNSIGLKATPNPNNGSFRLQFYISNSADVGISVVNMLGQKIYDADYPDFGGFFSNTVNLGTVSAGMYVLKVQVGGKKYLEKIMVY